MEELLDPAPPPQMGPMDLKVAERVKRPKPRTMVQNPSIFGYCYDMSTMAQTRAFADHLRRDLMQHFNGALHCLVNNAGIFNEERVETEVGGGGVWQGVWQGWAVTWQPCSRHACAGGAAVSWAAASPTPAPAHATPGRAPPCLLASLPAQDGLEETWAVNVAAPFLLTLELLDLVTERIINVTSISLSDSLAFDNLQASPRCAVLCYSSCAHLRARRLPPSPLRQEQRAAVSQPCFGF